MSNNNYQNFIYLFNDENFKDKLEERRKGDRRKAAPVIQGTSDRRTKERRIDKK